MKLITLLSLLGAGLLAPAPADEIIPSGADKAAAAQKHSKGSTKLADDQDSVSADVQELLDEQTNAEVIELLNQVEILMAETTDRLEEKNTGGETIAIQTEIIEKIYEAAKAKSKGKGESKEGQESMGAMLEMMKEMMGKGEKPGQKEGKGKGSQAGQGQKGDSDAANDAPSGGPNDGNATERRVPKAAGLSGAGLPSEFQKALDAYRQSAPKK